MKKYYLLLLTAASLLFVGCRDYNDFEFEGTVVGYRYCSSLASIQDLGYFVRLDAPDSVGGSFSVDGSTMKNVVVIYQSDRMLRDHDHIHGKIYLEPQYSKANCAIHSTGADKDLPEAVFTKLVVD